MNADAMRPPLDGIAVIDFSELLPGLFFTQSLAELALRSQKSSGRLSAIACGEWGGACSMQLTAARS